MKINRSQLLGVLLGIGVAAFLGACTRQETPDSHAGHGHNGHDYAAEAASSDAVESVSATRMCGEHGVPEAECAICKPDVAAALPPGQGMKVRLPSTNSLQAIGVESEPVVSGEISEGVECVAQVTFNQKRLARIVAPVSGIVEAVEVDFGTKLQEKETVAKIWSASIAEAVAKAVLAHQTLEREQKLRAQRVTSQAALEEAEATHRAACQQLRTLGFTEEQIDEMGHHPEKRVLMEVKTPFAGEVVDMSAVRGALVEQGNPLFTIADRSSAWAMLQIPESQIGLLHSGSAVELRVSAMPDRVFTGKLTWIGAAVDERTRMTRARAEFANPEGLLKDGMFASARVLTRSTGSALLVPESAVQRISGKPFVFVKLGNDLFDARAVRLGATRDARFEVVSGLKAGDNVAVKHTYALKSAMLMSRLGAGCADD